MALDSSMTGQEGLNSWEPLSMESCREGTGKIHGSDLYSLFCRGETPERETLCRMGQLMRFQEREK